MSTITSRRRATQLGSLLLFLALSMAGVTTGPAGAATEASGFQPDLQISANDGRTYVGNDAYNSAGRGQAVSRSAARGTSATFAIRLQIDLPVTPADISDITLRGCGRGNTSFSIKYYLSTSPRLDITSEVLAGGFVIDPMIGGASQILTEPSAMPFHVVVKVKQAAPVGATLTCKLQAETDSGVDAVKLTARRS